MKNSLVYRFKIIFIVFLLFGCKSKIIAALEIGSMIEYQGNQYKAITYEELRFNVDVTGRSVQSGERYVFDGEFTSQEIPEYFILDDVFFPGNQVVHFKVFADAKEFEGLSLRRGQKLRVYVIVEKEGVLMMINYVGCEIL
jgi:hypothetical protein